MNIVKRLTKKYYDKIFEFFSKHRIEILNRDVYNNWIENIKELQSNLRDYFVKKYEFFVSGGFDESRELIVEGGAVLKNCGNNSAEVKSIVFLKNEKGLINKTYLKDLIKEIEMYCAESGIKTIDFYTNSRNGTCSYFLDYPSHYFMLFKRRIDNEENYEYVFRRKILVDYTGDTTNLRDLALWFLDSVFLPYPNLEISSNELSIKDIYANKEIASFISSSKYQTGLFTDNYIEIPFSIASKSVSYEIKSYTIIELVAFVINVSIARDELSELVDKIKKLKTDKILLFSIDKFDELSDTRIKYINWETITSQVKHIHKQYLVNHG
ncbi:MAG: hypothetical protein JXA68_10570 [Ignavibacteriales bacterium]|nr:hypothetical protein [Ignavibacteriales bacterium]